MRFISKTSCKGVIRERGYRGCRVPPHSLNSTIKMATKTFKGTSMPKSELNAYGVGLLRLSEAHINAENFKQDEIEYIGKCSIRRRKVVLGRIGNVWGIAGRMAEQRSHVAAQFQAELRFRAHYVIEGKRVTVLHGSNGKTTAQAMSDFEQRDTSKSIWEMSAKELFLVAQGRRPSRKHAPKMGLSTRIANSIRMEK